jgi:hypothetical protein
VTNRTRTKRRRAAARAPKRRRGLIVAAALAAVAIATTASMIAVRSGTEDRPPSETFVRTGDVNGMGLPVIRTPGGAVGSASAGGVEVEGAVWRMGEVPLEAAVRPTWELVNTSSRPVVLGEPHPEVRAGCCPGPLSLGTRELAPGASTTLTFELSMHPGMDGWHDIAVHVPVGRAGGETTDALELVVTGDFRGSLD